MNKEEVAKVSEQEQIKPDSKVERLGRSGIADELEKDILSTLDKYVKKSFSREEAISFLNQVSEYFAVTNGMGIDGARKIVSLDEVFDHKVPKGQMGICPSSDDKKFGDKLGVSEVFLKGLSSRFVRVKSLPTAGTILVCHEATHAKQQATAQKDPASLTAEERKFINESSLDPRFGSTARSMKWADFRQVITNLSTLTGKKLDISPLELRNGIYFGDTKELDARANGIAACQELYQNLLDNPEIENYPEVKEWIGKQSGMIKLHERAERFLDKHIISKYKSFVESCNVPTDKLVEFATEQEKMWPEDGAELTAKQDAELKRKCGIYDSTIRIALKGKSSEELEDLYSQLDEEKTPYLKQLLQSSLSKQTAASKQTQASENSNQ